MFTIRWKDTKASPAVASHFESKLSKVLRFKIVKKDEIKAEIVFYQKENQFEARLTVPTNGSKTIASEAKEADVLTAINKVIDRTLDQLRRIKTKQINKKQA